MPHGLALAYRTLPTAVWVQIEVEYPGGAQHKTCSEMAHLYWVNKTMNTFSQFIKKNGTMSTAFGSVIGTCGGYSGMLCLYSHLIRINCLGDHLSYK